MAQSVNGFMKSTPGSPPSGFLHLSSLIHEQEEVDWVSGGCESQPNDPFWVDSLQPMSTASGNCYFFVAFGVFSYSLKKHAEEGVKFPPTQFY